MEELAKEDKFPRISLNKAGWRFAAGSASVVALSLLAALLAQGGLFTDDPGLPDHPDGLTTLALVLAVLAFLVQIFVFVFQTDASARSLRRSERLNAQTHEVLRKIEADSEATQRVLFSQFDRLLDYVVGGELVDDSSEGVEDEADLESGEGAEDAPMSASQVMRMINEAARVRERPQFEAETTNRPSEEDRRVAKYLSKWPNRDEAEKAVAALAKLSPFALALVTRFGMYELRQRRLGKPITLRKRGGPEPGLDELLEAGLVRIDEERVSLSDLGRAYIRVMPIGKPRGASRPDWVDEVLQPLLGGSGSSH